MSIAALDAAISETIGRPVRSDRLARDDAVFRAICRRAIARGSLRYRTTYAELAAGAGYSVPKLNCRENRRQARSQRVSTVYRALRSLQSAGLVRFHGVKRENGQWQCLSVGLTPAAYGPHPPFGRSRRRPTRQANGRISFLGESGTSPSVATAKRRPKGECVGAHAREAPEKSDDEPTGAFLRAALAGSEPPPKPEGPTPWPHERFDVPDPEIVELVELFEAEFGICARFSYERHGPLLRRYLDRLDRYSEPYSSRSGYRLAADLVRRWGRMRRLGNRRAHKVNSFAYLLPKLDQKSKSTRAAWRRRRGAAIWRKPPEKP